MGVLDLFRLDGKVALVTGAGQGLGRAFALALAEAGADVAVVDVQESTGRHVAEEVSALGRRASFIRADVTSQAEVEAMVSATVEQLGALDIGVNNAFSGAGDWYRVMDTRLNSVYLCCQAEAREMAKGARGKIVNVASISGTVANVGGHSYCAAKAGVIMLTRSMAVEWAAHNITVNSLSPTYCLSPVKRTETVEQRAKIRSLHPLGWYGRPEDLCGTLIYLVSNASNYVTGRDLIVDGGHTLNVWFGPVPRAAPPRVSPEEEVAALRHDLDVLGIPYDDDVVTQQ